MLTTVTITGADDQTDIDSLLELSQKYPFVEWAILYSPNQDGAPRYPLAKWRNAFIDAARGTAVRRAMHLCGPSVRELMSQGAQKLAYRAGYQRVQLNFNAKRFTNAELIKLARSAGWAEFWDGSPQGVIVQHNSANEAVPEIFISNGCSDVQVLFDSSGGRGLELDTYPTPLPDFLCGYAGGIGPDNIDSALQKAAAAAGSRDYWIDMESKVRTDEVFDLEKVEKVLASCANWMKAYGKTTSKA